MEKTKVKKEPAYNIKSRRQLWQMFQHNEKVLAFASAAKKQVKDNADPLLVRSVDELIVSAFVTSNRIKRLSKKLFNCSIESLEVYK